MRYGKLLKIVSTTYCTVVYALYNTMYYYIIVLDKPQEKKVQKVLARTRRYCIITMYMQPRCTQYITNTVSQSKLYYVTVVFERIVFYGFENVFFFFFWFAYTNAIAERRKERWKKKTANSERTQRLLRKHAAICGRHMRRRGVQSEYKEKRREEKKNG